MAITDVATVHSETTPSKHHSKFLTINVVEKVFINSVTNRASTQVMYTACVYICMAVELLDILGQRTKNVYRVWS